MTIFESSSVGFWQQGKGIGEYFQDVEIGIFENLTVSESSKTKRCCGKRLRGGKPSSHLR
jgi:hypothetical protein